MKEAKEIYKDDIGNDISWFCITDYQPMLEEFGNILIQVDDDDYSGDSRVLYEKSGKYGFLIFGWGSCSGCDALQAAKNINKIQELMDDLQNEIMWFSSIDDLKKYFIEKDWELEYCWHIKNTKEFINKVINYDSIN